jgi:hypothetical protein
MYVYMMACTYGSTCLDPYTPVTEYVCMCHDAQITCRSRKTCWSGFHARVVLLPLTRLACFDDCALSFGSRVSRLSVRQKDTSTHLITCVRKDACSMHINEAASPACTRPHARMHTHIRKCIHASANAYTHAQMHTYTHTHTHTFTIVAWKIQDVNVREHIAN